MEISIISTKEDNVIDKPKPVLDSLYENKDMEKIKKLPREDLLYLARKAGLKFLFSQNTKGLISLLYGEFSKPAISNVSKVKEKLKLRLKEGWEESRFCDVFKILTSDELISLAKMYGISATSEDVICKELEDIFFEKKQEYSKCTKDPISGNEIELQKSITFVQDEIDCCFDIEELVDYINDNKYMNPYTNTRFTPEIFSYIDKEYSLYLDKLLENQNYKGYSKRPDYMFLVTSYFASRYRDVMYVFNGIEYNMGIYGFGVGSKYGIGHLSKDIHTLIIKFIFSIKQRMMLPLYLPGHANMLMFSKTKNRIVCERFEPRYIREPGVPNTAHYAIDENIRAVLNEYHIKFYSHRDIDCDDGPQTRDKDQYGYCQTYSLLHAEYMLAEPSLSSKEIMSTYDYSQEELDNFIRKIIKTSILDFRLKKEIVTILVNFDKSDMEERSKVTKLILYPLVNEHLGIPELRYKRIMEASPSEFSYLVHSLITFFKQAPVGTARDELTNINDNILRHMDKYDNERKELLKELSDTISYKKLPDWFPNWFN